MAGSDQPRVLNRPRDTEASAGPAVSGKEPPPTMGNILSVYLGHIGLARQKPHPIHWRPQKKSQNLKGP